jgi:thiol-disulfide isomerase/thioredoxin
VSPHRRSPRLLLLSLLLASFLLPFGAPAAAQGLRLRGLKGEQLADSEITQGTAIVVVWASWSPRSHDIVERVNPLAQRWGGRARVVTVNFQEEAAAVQGFLAGKALAVPVFLDSDGAFSKKYAIATLPGLLVVKDGQVVYRGKLPDDPGPILDKLLGG